MEPTKIYPLRYPCPHCEHERGFIRSKGSQDSMFCERCYKFLYNAPRTETGREVRTLQSVRHSPPGQRARILERAHGRCELCGAADRPLTIGHILSMKEGFNLVSDFQLNSDDNCMALCEECNAGIGETSLPLWLAEALLYRRRGPTNG